MNDVDGSGNGGGPAIDALCQVIDGNRAGAGAGNGVGPPLAAGIHVHHGGAFIPHRAIAGEGELSNVRNSDPGQNQYGTGPHVNQGPTE